MFTDYTTILLKKRIKKLQRRINDVVFLFQSAQIGNAAPIDAEGKPKNIYLTHHSLGFINK